MSEIIGIEMPKKNNAPEMPELDEVEGIGPAAIKKLRAAGIESVMELSVSRTDELSEDASIAKDTAEQYIMSAQQLLRERQVLEKEFVSAREIAERRSKQRRCSTGSKALDEFFGKSSLNDSIGIESGAVTELFGQFSSGKTQICHTLSVMASQPHENGGLNGRVLLLDTEVTFRPERITQIAQARGLDADKAMDSITVCNVISAAHLELVIKNIAKYIEQYNVKLLIVDSIIAMHRAEFAGRGTLSDRQQRLNGIMHKLVRIADQFNIVVVITNQVQTSPDTFFGDPTKPTGGNIVGHNSTYRVKLIKAGETNIAKMIDSPYHAYSDCRFSVTEAGVTDAEEKKKKSSDKDEE